MLRASRLALPIAVIAFVWSACDGPVDTTDRPGPEIAAPTAALTPSENSYVLMAGQWRGAQTRAVQRAGGTITFSHERSGIGVVTSADPDFLDNVLRGGAFIDGAADVMVQWQEPMEAWEVEANAVTPGDETFFAFQWNMLAIEAPGAWAAGFDGSGVRVAVLDGGIYDVHADLSANLDKACSVSFVPGQPYNNDSGTFWHATHVAGIIAAADNGFGVIGVAPAATLLGVKVLHGGGGTFGQVIGGILYASDPAAFGAGGCQRADIINMSLSAVFSKDGLGVLVAAMARAVNYATSHRVLVISAAGNDALDFGQLRNYTIVPAQSGSGLAIAASGPTNFIGGNDNYRRFASYSNYGEDLVYLTGPGGDVAFGPGIPFDAVLSSCRGTSTPPVFSFCFAIGTSMAAPAAAGVAALIMDKYPGISLGALKTKLKNTADDEGKIGKDEFYGHGYVNAFQAVTE